MLPRAAIPASDEDHGAVSAVVITHNGTDYVQSCFGSLAGQSYKNLEIIAVDNGSTDGTPRRIREDFPYVGLHELPRNSHFAAAVNIGIAPRQGPLHFYPEPGCRGREGMCSPARRKGEIGAQVPPRSSR